MSFWDKVSDALPSKSIARGHELQMSEIKRIGVVPDAVLSANPSAFQCQVCTVTPKSAFTKNTKIFDIYLSDSAKISIDFADPIARVLQVCEGCVDKFNLVTAHKRYLSEVQLLENEQERIAIKNDAQKLKSQKQKFDIDQRKIQQKEIDAQQREFRRMKMEYERKRESEQQQHSSAEQNKSEEKPLSAETNKNSSITSAKNHEVKFGNSKKPSNEKQMATGNSLKVKCKQCGFENLLSLRKIKNKHIFPPGCSVCSATLIF